MGKKEAGLNGLILRGDLFLNVALTSAIECST